MAKIGIDLGGTKMLVSYMDGDKQTTKKYATGIDISFNEIIGNYTEFVKENNLTVESLAVAIPGLIDNRKVTACDVLPCLEGITAADFSSNYPVSFINDVEAALIEERNNYSNVKNLIVIMVGTGIGMSMVVDGSECKGATGFAGELGYTTINTENGPTYLDNISAGAGILKTYNGSAEELKSALEKGDNRAKGIIENASNYMGMAISSVVSLFNPEVVVIGGGTASYTGYFKNLKNSVEKYTLPVLMEPTQIVRTTNPGLTAVNGAIKKAESLTL